MITDKDRERAEEVVEITKLALCETDSMVALADKLAEYREQDQQKPEATFVTNDKVGSVSQ